MNGMRIFYSNLRVLATPIVLTTETHRTRSGLTFLVYREIPIDEKIPLKNSDNCHRIS